MYPPPTPRPFIGARRSGSGAPTPTTPRRSPPALKRRGLRAASQHRPLYSFWAGPPFEKGPGAAGSPCGAVPALGRKRPAPWLAAGGALRGRGCLRARAPPSTAAPPCCPVGNPIIARHQGSARGVHALPLTQRGPYTQAPASSPAAALRRAVPLILCGPGP